MTIISDFKSNNYDFFFLLSLSLWWYPPTAHLRDLKKSQSLETKRSTKYTLHNINTCRIRRKHFFLTTPLNLVVRFLFIMWEIIRKLSAYFFFFLPNTITWGFQPKENLRHTNLSPLLRSLYSIITLSNPY